MIAVVAATGNPGKLAELRRMLGDLPLQLFGLGELGLPAPAEDAPSFAENALLKARAAARASGLPALADDSGLMVEALAGRPGLLSARYGGPGLSDGERVARLLAELEGLPETQRGARFHCALAFVASAEDPAPLIATGEWQGRILERPRGGGGFGYDPVFLDPTVGLTAAELPAAEKDRLSHRGRALARLRESLRERLLRP